MRENMALLRWLDTAVSGIPFGPDRKAVRAELYAHMEDKTLDLARIFPGISPDEARDLALASMGDPEELKLELARIHTPWLGWLWQISRVLVWCALALAVAAGLFRLPDFVSYGWQHMENGRAQYEAYRAERDALFGAGAEDCLAPEAELRMGRGAISVPRAAWRQEAGEDVLYLQLRVTWDRPWEMEEGVFRYVQIQNGQRILEEAALRQGEERGLNWIQRTLRLPGVPRDTQRVELVYLPFAPGAAPALTVDLTREARS